MTDHAAEYDARIERACEVMHDAYEAAAVGAGWETQTASRKPWAEVPEANKATMRAAVSALIDHLAESAIDHQPVEVWSVDGMPFVRCSCDLTSGSRPQSAVWLREHWQGTQNEGVAALQAVVARQREEVARV